MKILNINHNDGDAVGSQLVLEYSYGRENVKVERCNYNNVNGVLYDYLKNGEHKNYDLIYITDISISEKMAEWVDKDFSDKVKLVDHHSTALWLNKYKWATVKEVDDKGRKISATKLLAQIEEIGNYVLLDVVECINDYDCWHWAENGNMKAKNFNDLLYLVGFDEIIESVHQQLFDTKTTYQFDEKYEFLLEIRDREYKHYLESSDKSIQVVEYDGYKAGVVMAERFTSELGNDLAKLHPELDFIALLNMRSGLSLRGVKEGIHLGEIAKEIGGLIGANAGGHPRASAISLTSEYKLGFLKEMFDIV